MKKLQNNFTIPEQSRRLLELGLPADSADCYYYSKLRQTELLIDGVNFNVYIDYMCTKHQAEVKDFLPCWSVGRLIEIYCILSGHKGFVMYSIEDLIEEIIYKINALKEQGILDFSKLEE